LTFIFKVKDTPEALNYALLNQSGDC